MEKTITDIIIENFGFGKIHGVFKSKFSEKKNEHEASESISDDIDVHKFSAIKRIGEIHYLFYSENYKYFSIGVKLEKSMGLPGGGIKYWNIIMIPKLMLKESDVENFLKGILSDFDFYISDKIEIKK